MARHEERPFPRGHLLSPVTSLRRMVEDAGRDAADETSRDGRQRCHENGRDGAGRGEEQQGGRKARRRVIGAEVMRSAFSLQSRLFR